MATFFVSSRFYFFYYNNVKLFVIFNGWPKKKEKANKRMNEKKGFSLFWSFQGGSHEMPRRKWNRKKSFFRIV